MENPNQLEQELLNIFVSFYPEYKAHLKYLRVTEREYTGVGMFSHFTYVETMEDLEVENKNLSFSNNENIQIPNLQYGLGYELNTSNGKIDLLELITYGEDWFGPIKSFKLVEGEL